MAAQLQEKYREQVVPAMMKREGYDNVMQVPRIEKVVLNIGIGEAINNAKALDAAMGDLAAISGQRPISIKSKKSISAFGLRKGATVGTKVTLRGERMWLFLQKLISVTLPRIREFAGISATAWDGRGNYTLGLKEQTVFPEIEYDKVDKLRGLEITIVTNARTDEEGKALLELLGMPFSKE